jgi:glycosyltransferase involved in cell wall biosynthesis
MKGIDSMSETVGTNDNQTRLTSSTHVTHSSASDPKHLICFSHLRWNFVYQRPQHLLSRATSDYHVWFLEEPIWDNEYRLNECQQADKLTVLVPHIPHGTPHEEAIRMQRQLLDNFLAEKNISSFIGWYYTPMALQFSDHLTPRMTIYDCMDELSAFLGAPPQLLTQEQRLIDQADLVFTGGYSLYEAKQHRHPHVFAFPSSIDFNHFAVARQEQTDPIDQQSHPKPRLGFSGVIDERFDYKLVGELAEQHPDWQFILVGPIVKINRALLPKGPNVHYLGMKSYNDLPTYFSNWDVAILPFALNESTRFISPTKTPEYLAAGLPVVSTPIKDVVRTYGTEGFVQIADSTDSFGAAVELALSGKHPENWEAIDAFLKENSWNHTWHEMHRLILAHLNVAVDQ